MSNRQLKKTSRFSLKSPHTDPGCGPEAGWESHLMRDCDCTDDSKPLFMSPVEEQWPERLVPVNFGLGCQRFGKMRRKKMK